MSCSACGHAVPERAKFCNECGAAVVPRCASCGTELLPAAKFCNECGAPVAAAAPGARRDATGARRDAAGARKIVTIVFADLVGSTALHERLDPESARRFMESYYAAMRDAVESHGGTVTQLLGDGVKAVFGIPQVAEDDAIRAVRAAVAMQEAFRALAEQQRGAVGKTGLRVAVNTGEVVANDETEIIGDPVNVAARLQEQGRDGDVVVGESAHRLVATLVTLELLGSFALKGRSEAVKAYRVVSLERPAGAATAPFVGRAEELARLEAVYETAVETPAAGLAVLVGSPGLGKSRLIDEFARRHADAATVVTAHCDAAGGATFAPLAEALRELLAFEASATAESLRASVEGALPGDSADRARIAGGITALLSGAPASPEETFFVVRRMLGALAQHRPVVLVIDDLQWAEPLLLDLVEHLIQWGRGVRLLVLVGARPELRELRSSLATPGGFVADVITLTGLDARAAMRLAANVIGANDLPTAVAAKVLATSEGNPLFVGELVRMLVQEGALTREGERWTIGTGLASLEMPPTIHALLAARIERLRPEERSVLEHAAVVGRHFSRNAVAALLPGEAAGLDAALEALRRSELIERDTGWLLGEPVLRFHHVLTRDAAYRRLLKGTRAELHGRLADWIEAQVDDAPEHDETVGRHLEQAHQLLGELGPLDEDGKRLGERAASRLAAAGRAALAGDDVPLAASLLGRALDRLDADDPARAALALDWCEALLAAGDVGAAVAAIDELGRFIADSDRLRAWHTCFAGQHTVLTAPEALDTTADAVAAAATALAAQDDAAGEAKAHFVYALALARLGKIGACEAALDQALAAARRAGDRRRANTILAIAPLAALWGPSPVTRASGRCLDVVRVLRITQGAPAVEAVALSCQGVLEALRGRTDAARRMIASARTMVEELGITQRLLEVDVFAGLVALLEGDAPAAGRVLRGAYDGLRELGLGIDAARAAALLARALLAQDRAADAETLSHESEALAGDDLKAAIAWRGVRAEALARRGEHAAAIELASKAVEIAAATDALLDHADARLALAAALRATGRGSDADAEERRARELWETKGATLLGEQARRDRADVAPPTVTPTPRVAPTPPGTPTAQGRVRPNAATRNADRFHAAFVARDVEAFMATISEQIVVVYHPTGTEHGASEAAASLRWLFAERQVASEQKALATLGDCLALHRRSTRSIGITDDAFGPAETEMFSVVEVDGRGLATRAEYFGADHLQQAIACLYERHASLLPEGPARERASAIARTARAFGDLDDFEGVLDGLGDVLAPSAEVADHRLVGFGTARGVKFALTNLRALHDLTENLRFRCHDVLALSPDQFLVRVTNSGTARDGGGTFERNLCPLFRFGADGLFSHWETFDTDHEAEALARFDELAGSDTSLPASPYSDAAWRRLERIRRCWETRDWSGVEDTFSPGFRFDDRRRLSRVEEVSREDYLVGFRMLFDQPGSRWEGELLATRGEQLALSRTVYRADVEDGGGPLELAEALTVSELDADGRCIALVLFNPEDEDAAYAELDARYEAGEGGMGARTIGAFVRAFVSRDWDALRALAAPGVVDCDHRRLALRGTIHGVEAWVQSFRGFADLAPDITWRTAHVRGHRRAFLVQGVLRGTREGGVFEFHLVAVTALDEQGRLERVAWYDVEQFDDARAQFEELTSAMPRPTRRVRTTAATRIATGAMIASTVRPERFANAATRAAERGMAAIAARDWDGFTALFAPNFRSFDRRTLVRLESGRDEWLESHRQIIEMTVGLPKYEVLATRGDRLALVHMLWQGAEGDVGPSEIDWLLLIEVDERGDHCAVVTFDPDDLDAAYEELDERLWAQAGSDSVWANGRAWREVYRQRDWDAVAALCSPDFEFRDHRLAGFGTVQGVSAYLETARAMVALAPDVQLRTHHQIKSGRAILAESVWLGTRDGGAFESPMLAVLEVDEHDRVRRVEAYDPQHFERARARFDKVVRTAASPDQPRALATPRAASAGLARWKEALDSCVATDNWDAMRGICAPGMVFEDRRRLSLVSGDAELMIASARERVVVGARPEFVQIGAGGDRVGLWRMLWSGGPADGRFEIEYIALIEVNESELLTAILIVDLDDPRAAVREMWSRWVAIDPTIASLVELIAKVCDAFDVRDRARMRALYADDLVVEDHRLAGMGRIEGADAYLDSVQVLWDLAPAAKAEQGWFWPAIRPDGAVTMVRRFGDLSDRGPFESECLQLFLHDTGRFTHVELFEVGALDTALARFEELRPDRRPGIPPNAARQPSTQTRHPTQIRPSTQPDPLAAIARPNAASVWLDRLRLAFNARDWDAVRDLVAPEVTYEDRQRLAQLSGGDDMIISSVRERAEAGARLERIELLGTAGNRIAIHRMLWAGGAPDSRFEMEFLIVQEVDESGRLAASINFDLDDTRSAQREAWARWVAIDPVAKPWVDFASMLADAYNNRDLTAPLMGDENLIVDDRRRTGFGYVEGRDAYFEAVTALWDLAPDTRIEFGWHWPACDRHATVTTMRRSGTLPGGGAFEADDLTLMVMTGGVVTRIEFFELDALETALERFEELRPDPLRIPPNAAVRAHERWYEAVRSGDADASAALHDASYTLDDRRPLLRMTADRGGEIGNARFMFEGGWRSTRTLLATAGDRLALQRIVWTTGEASARSEVDILELDEVDDEGCFVRVIIFDPDDRATASAELFERWAATGADGMPAAVIDYMRAWNEHDLDRLRTLMPDDYYFHDHRRTGIGRVEAEAHIASLAALYELSPDVRLEILDQVATAEYGKLFLARWFGTNAEGGEFESLFHTLSLYRDEQPAGFEIFETDDRDAALARFEELGAAGASAEG